MLGRTKCVENWKDGVGNLFTLESEMSMSTDHPTISEIYCAKFVRMTIKRCVAE
jgi:hypothetical protein